MRDRRDEIRLQAGHREIPGHGARDEVSAPKHQQRHHGQAGEQERTASGQLGEIRIRGRAHDTQRRGKPIIGRRAHRLLGGCRRRWPEYRMTIAVRERDGHAEVFPCGPSLRLVIAGTSDQPNQALR